MAKFEFTQWLVDWLMSCNAYVFQWDDGNQTKSKAKHDVEIQESEQPFYDDDKVPMGIQTEPLTPEPRFGLIGKTMEGRCLHVVFTIIDNKIRIISARPAHKKERSLYEKIREE